jgi:hypothetical protein
VSEELLRRHVQGPAARDDHQHRRSATFLKEKEIDFAARRASRTSPTTSTVAPTSPTRAPACRARLRVALPLGFEFKDLFTIYPNFKHSRTTRSATRRPGDALGGGWTLLGGVITEFDNRPSPGLKKADDTYFIGLGLTF